jgi:hypothetical protein
MEAMLIVLAGMAVLAALDLAAWVRGADSGDGINAQEWERRKEWPR